MRMPPGPLSKRATGPEGSVALFVYLWKLAEASECLHDRAP